MEIGSRPLRQYRGVSEAWKLILEPAFTRSVGDGTGSGTWGYPILLQQIMEPNYEHCRY